MAGDVTSPLIVDAIQAEIGGKYAFPPLLAFPEIYFPCSFALLLSQAVNPNEDLL